MSSVQEAFLRAGWVEVEYDSGLHFRRSRLGLPDIEVIIDVCRDGYAQAELIAGLGHLAVSTDSSAQSVCILDFAAREAYGCDFLADVANVLKGSTPFANTKVWCLR